MKETYKLNINDASYKHIETALKQLKSYLSQKRYKSLEQITYELSLSEWILDQPDKEKKSSQYLRARFKNGVLPKSTVVKQLGWKFP
jgi:uncharacterized protein (UPF0297 family)